MPSSEEESSSSEDLKDDEKASTKKPEEKQPEKKAEGGKTVQVMFIHFEAVPRTMKQFDDMTKFWVGFPQALNQIGLKFEEVKKRLQEGKEQFEDEEAVKKACDEALERLQESKRLKEAADKALKQSEVGTAAKVAPKPALKPKVPTVSTRKTSTEGTRRKTGKNKEKGNLIKFHRKFI